MIFQFSEESRVKIVIIDSKKVSKFNLNPKTLYANNSIPTKEAIIIKRSSKIVNKLIDSSVEAIAINISLNEVHDRANLNILNIRKVLKAETAVKEPLETDILDMSKTCSTSDIMTITQSNVFIESLK